MNKIFNYQQRLKEQPSVWTVAYKVDGFWEDGNDIYDSKEAAQIELDWALEHKEKAKLVRLGHVHNKELSEIRWRKS